MKIESRSWTRWLEWPALGKLAAVLVAALVIPNLGLPQAITGPLVNALLLLTVSWVGVSAAIGVGLVTPLAALVHGVLPLPMAVMIPFIMVANALFVSVYGRLSAAGSGKPARYPVALGLAALAKFLLLWAAVTALVVHPLSLGAPGHLQTVAMPAALVQMMTWPQLLTALAGGLIAWGVERLARR